MYRVDIKVRVISEGEAVELEMDALMDGEPFVGLGLGDAPGGAVCPLELTEVERSTGDGTFRCRAEDHRVHPGVALDAVVAEYLSCGWRVARRARLGRRDAS